MCLCETLNLVTVYNQSRMNKCDNKIRDVGCILYAITQYTVAIKLIMPSTSHTTFFEKILYIHHTILTKLNMRTALSPDLHWNLRKMSLLTCQLPGILLLPGTPPFHGEDCSWGFRDRMMSRTVVEQRLRRTLFVSLRTSASCTRHAGRAACYLGKREAEDGELGTSPHLLEHFQHLSFDDLASPSSVERLLVSPKSLFCKKYIFAFSDIGPICWDHT